MTDQIVCSHCVEKPAVKRIKFEGRGIKLCAECWKFLSEHKRLPMNEEGGPKPTKPMSFVGSKEKPRLDEIERRLK
jgi:hypothetical protein